jgi:hypothetical protein
MVIGRKLSFFFFFFFFKNKLPPKHYNIISAISSINSGTTSGKKFLASTSE